MTKPIAITLVALHPSRGLDILDGAGTIVHAVSGVVWITQQGDRRDVVLRAGDCFLVDRDGLTIVSALGAPATVTVVPAQESSTYLHYPFSISTLEPARL
jgi:Protein of unknown function (DUF2917)